MTPTASSELAGLLCDLDGVLRLWPADHVDAAERLVGLPHGSIHAVAFAPDLLTLAVTAAISEISGSSGGMGHGAETPSGAVSSVAP